MITEVSMQSFGPLSKFEATRLGAVNLFIGHNGSGKTIALKALYAAQKTIEQYRRGKEPLGIKQLLFQNLFWIFQVEELKELVKKGEQTLSFRMSSAPAETFSYTFTSSTVREISKLDNTYAPTDVNSVFIPAKEVISLQDIILRSYDVDKMFGFDRTYSDLARALNYTSPGRVKDAFKAVRNRLGDAIGGKLEFNKRKKEWFFRDKQAHLYSIAMTSEGIKRLSIIQQLLSNHYLSSDSVVFIDETEANLHPALIADFMEIILLLAKEGIQFFISSHSYFVIKNLYLLAQQHKMSIPVFSFERGEVTGYDLLREMPQNPIIQESIDLYQREIELD